MGSFEQDVNTAPCINQDTVDLSIGDLYRDDHGVIVGLDRVVDVFFGEHNPG